MAHVLLIEPNAVLARTYVQALQHVGHVVSHASTAQDAVHAADEQKPDIVILELQLSGHNGIEFLHEFRSYAEWQYVPVCINTVVSPAVLESSREPLRTLGVEDCMYKPRTSLQHLISVVNQRAAAS